MIIVSLVASLAALILLLPAVSDIVALCRAKGTAPPADSPEAVVRHVGRSRLLFLVPAHNEELLIEDCVRSILDLRYPPDCLHVVVLADNCSDATVAKARALGVTCLERHDTVHQGKPHALKWGLDQLRLEAYDAVVILDADAVVDPDYAFELDREAPLRAKAVECYNDVRNPDESPITRMAAIMSASRFLGSFVLKRRVGLSIPLSAGMCLGVDVLREHPWDAFGLSEDWELYAKLTAAGVTIDLAPRARLFAKEAGTFEHASGQRQRWLAGRIDALWRAGPAILRSTRITWHQKLDAITELASPGPAVHLGACALLSLTLLAGKAPGAPELALLLGLSLIHPIAWAAVGLRHARDPVRALAAFAYFPAYAAWRLSVAVSAVRLFRHDAKWVRAPRA